MPWRRALLLALFSGAASAQVTIPELPPGRTQPPARFQTPDEVNAAIARKAPAFEGFYFKDSALHVVVTSTDPAARQAAVRELFLARPELLRRPGVNPGKVIFVPAPFSADQLQQAKEIAGGIPGWQSIDIDETQGRVVVELRLPGMEERAQAYLAGQHLPAGIIVLQSAPAGKLPEGPGFKPPHQARLSLPTRVAQGDVLVTELKLTNSADAPLDLEHGACAFFLEVVNADTGKVVLPIPGNEICEASLHLVRVPARSNVTLASEEWNLRTPSGEMVPPGRYIARAAFEVGALDKQIIRPVDQAFEVVAGKTQVGAAQVREVLRDGASNVTFQARLGEDRGRQVVRVIVPDTRARLGVERLLRERHLPLDRVRFQLLPLPKVPSGTGQGKAELLVESHTSLGGTQHGFELNADLAPWLTRGAWRCELVVNVVDPRTGEMLGGWPGLGLGVQPHPCSEGGQPPAFPWRGGWNERRSDGTLLPAGTYEVRAGLKVSLPGSQVGWLLATPQKLVVP